MIVIKNTDINLKDTITCGQIFRYIEEKDNSYTVILPDRVVNLKKENNNLIVLSNKEENLKEVIEDYLDLNRDYNKLNDEILKKDDSLKDIINSCKGLKMIHQPKFECSISYILSQNNRVPQIAKALNNISEKYGEKVIFNNNTYYLFPSIDKLKNASIEDFRNLKTGFRDKYLYNFIHENIDLESIDKMNTEDALKYLISIKGIGEKVASCILIFAYSRFDVFPIDTWVKKFMKEKYNLESIKDIRDYTKDKYNQYCGLVIQYIFNYKRNKD